MLIDAYLEKCLSFVEDYEKANNIDLSDLKQTALELKEIQTKLTKNQVIRKLAKLWAIARDKGLPVLKVILFEYGKHFVFDLINRKLLGQ